MDLIRIVKMIQLIKYQVILIAKITLSNLLYCCRSYQCLVQIFYQISNVFQANSQSDQVDRNIQLITFRHKGAVYKSNVLSSQFVMQVPLGTYHKLGITIHMYIYVHMYITIHICIVIHLVVPVTYIICIVMTVQIKSKVY